MTNHYRKCALAVFAASSLAASAADTWVAPARAAQKKNPTTADEKSITTGKIVYEKECLSCHGATGKGDGPKANQLKKHAGDFSLPKMWEQTDGALFWKTTEGKMPMPKYDKLLTEEERWHVINYIRTLAPKPASPDPQPKEADKK